jgi:hypothetical protein
MHGVVAMGPEAGQVNSWMVAEGTTHGTVSCRTSIYNASSSAPPKRATRPHRSRTNSHEDIGGEVAITWHQV